MSLWAVIFKIWDDEPIYHRLASVDSTACGRRLGESKPSIPFKHAVKFAKPCKGCFPERGCFPGGGD